ncbi:GntR family transcriptional regulator [Pelagovum pacificum]|uniref:GntR family transcriptional regulator n=1 Tax=Pelagovum pacificum TaxID=2588711 RepID=A0A5C5GDB0_9RHOB|nr:GntR family transcriptional regulator [Pelagovum pacificum]QQA44220.1 GntR family transcriptional regulator [Pelagovum pacificum]TNY32658.1 GntR family transcriptional regulator [Pelagovum pacificum]
MSTEPLHARIFEDLRRRIVDGELTPGTRLPKETELAEAHGVARMTMNRVLSDLARDGFIVRRKRSGTFVAQPRGQSAVMEITDIAQEVAALGLRHEWRLESAERKRLSAAERTLLSLTPEDAADEVLLLRGLHLARGEPFCLETRAIDLRVAAGALDEDFAQTVPGQWLLRTMPWSAARHRVRAVNVAGRDARTLALSAGTACLEVLRETTIGEDWVTHVRLLYPGEAHQLVAEFAPQG